MFNTLVELVQFSSVAQLCPTLCDPMNCSTPSLRVHRQILEFTQTYIHWLGDAIQLSNPLSSPFPPDPNPSQHQNLFQWVNSLHEVAKVVEFQLLASFIPKNTQNWSPLEWTGWISLQSMGLSRVFSKTTVQKHHPLAPSFFHIPNLTSIHDYWKNNSFDLMDFAAN